MLTATELNIDTLPVGWLGIIALESSKTLGEKINNHIVSWRQEREHVHSAAPEMADYEKDSYLVPVSNPRFTSGEAKGMLFGSVRGADLYLLVDVCNYNITYNMSGITNRMSPDDHFQDLKRIISAIEGKARRITVIMPYLYESRQLLRTGRESLDCAMALQELIAMGVDSIITFDAHDPRVQNAIPLHGFETYQPVYQFIKVIFRSVPDFTPDSDHAMIISPDEGGMKRAITMASLLGGIDMGMFYKRRDYTRFENGENPVIAHEFLGSDVTGKDCIIVDDMISSGGAAIECAKALRRRGAKRVLICATFGLFTNGLSRFDEAYENGDFQVLLTTNLVYQTPELLSKPYYTGCDLSKYLALIIDTMNHDGSVSSLLDPVDRVNLFLENQKKRQRGE